ncbi:MAG: hypothetical protein ACK5ND_05275 [Bacteroides sp.]
MMRITLITLMSFLLLSCNGQNNRNQSDNSRTEKLTEAYNKKDYATFLRLFPGNFNEFQDFYGFDDVTGEKPLYTVAEKQIEYLFTGVQNELPLIKKVIPIAIGGKWDADAVNYFQHNLINLLENHSDKVFEVLSTKSESESKQFWYFIFDSPHPDNEQNKKLIADLSNKFGSENNQISYLKEEFAKVMSEETH